MQRIVSASALLALLAAVPGLAGEAPKSSARALPRSRMTHDGRVSSGPGDKTLVSASWKRKIKLWGVATGKEEAEAATVGH